MHWPCSTLRAVVSVSSTSSRSGQLGRECPAADASVGRDTTGAAGLAVNAGPEEAAGADVVSADVVGAEVAVSEPSGTAGVGSDCSEAWPAAVVESARAASATKAGTRAEDAGSAGSKADAAGFSSAGEAP